MKHGIILLFVWGICFNKVASYHRYAGPEYRQGVYQQRPDWSNNQNYARNRNPAYPVNQPPVNFRSPKPVENIRRDHPIEANYENVEVVKQEPVYVHPQKVNLEPRVVQQSDEIYADKQPESVPQTYPEVPRSYLPERSHGNFGAQPSHWRRQPPLPPPSQVFIKDNYPPQALRHWPHQNQYPYNKVLPLGNNGDSNYQINQPQENRDSISLHHIVPTQFPKYKSNFDNIATLRETKDIMYENAEDVKKYSELLIPLEEEYPNKYNERVPFPVNTNPTNNFNLPLTDTVETYNNYKKPTFDSMPKSEENYPSEFKYLNPPQFQSNSFDTLGLAEYADKSASNYVKKLDAYNPLGDIIFNTSRNEYLIKPMQTDDININTKTEPANIINDDIFDNKDQIKISTQESNDDTEANVQNNPKDNLSVDKSIYNVTNITSLIAQNTDGENINISDTDNTILQTVLNSTDLEKVETVDNELQPTAEPVSGSYNFSLPATDETALNPPERNSTQSIEAILSDVDITKDGGIEKAETQQRKNTDVEVEAKTDKESDENGADIDSINLVQPITLPTANNPVIMLRPDEHFWDGLYSENEARSYDGYNFCDVKITDLVIEKTSKFYMYENRSFVEETEEIVWEHKDDAVPIEIKTTRIIRNPKGEHTRQDGATETSRCFKQPKT